MHASAILTPLCLSYGFHVSKDAKKIIKAFIVGWEIAARVGIASKGTFHKRGFHTTAIAGSFASGLMSFYPMDLIQKFYILLMLLKTALWWLILLKTI